MSSTNSPREGNVFLSYVVIKSGHISKTGLVCVLQCSSRHILLYHVTSFDFWLFYHVTSFDFWLFYHVTSFDFWLFYHVTSFDFWLIYHVTSFDFWCCVCCMSLLHRSADFSLVVRGFMTRFLGLLFHL